MTHVPVCPVCHEREVGSLRGGSEDFCSSTCEGIAHAESLALRLDEYEIRELGLNYEVAYMMEAV